MAVLSGDLLAALNAQVVDEAFESARSNRTGILGSVSIGEAARLEEGQNLNWLDSRIDARQSTLTAGVNDSVTTIPVADGSVYRAGVVCSAVGSDEVIQVTSVSGNNLTVLRAQGGTTGAAIASGVALVIDSVGRPENSQAADDNIIQPVTRENYFQTMDTAIQMSRRALATLQHGNTNDLSYQLAEATRQLTTQMDRALVRGRKMEVGSGASKVTYAGGMKYWFDQADAIVTDHSSAALTLDAINALNESVLERGGTTDTIAVGLGLGRRLSALVSANYSSQRLADFTADEGSITALPSDMPLVGNVNRIVIDTNLNSDELFLYDSGSISVVPAAAGNADAGGNWRTLDATQPGQDGERARILGDWSFEIRNYQSNMARLHNIGS